MKRLLFCLAALMLLSVGCSKNKPDVKKITLALSVDKGTLKADNTDFVTFSVVNQENQDVSSKVTIKVNGTAISGNTFKTANPGTYKVVATLGDVTSNEISITAEKPNVEEQKEKTLVLTADKASILADGKDKITFTVKKKDGTDITSDPKTKIRVNGIELSQNTYVAITAKEYRAAAVFGEEESNELVFQANIPQDIKLEADVVQITFDGEQKVTFKVSDKDGKDITKDSQIFYGDKTLEGNVFLPTSSGFFTFKAKYQGNISNIINITVLAPITNFYIKVDKEQFTADGEDIASFMCFDRDQKDKDITELVTFEVNGKEIKGNYFSSTQKGTFIVKAKLKKHFSQPVTITGVNEFVPTSRIYAEDFTGLWCPYCPRYLFMMEDATKESKIVGLAIHVDDIWHTPEGNKIGKKLNVKGYPTVVIYRKEHFSGGATVNNLLSYRKPTTDVGISMTTEVVDNEVVANVKIKATKDMKDIKCVAILFENKLEGWQKNALGSSNGLPNPFKSEHNHVYRTSHESNTFGSAIELTANTTLTKTFKFAMKGNWKKENCGVAILITNANDEVINAQRANVGAGCGF
ncbi:MAG: Omp28-related outer membrane protein [Porphyromonas sp.]|nr:Omp28-related outer membrane protein [Porphyromonas sp.]